MSEKHSTVCYIFREGAFSPVREAKPFHNDFGLDLFQYKGAVYEGRTGLQFCPLKQAADIASFIGKHGGLEKVQKLIADSSLRWLHGGYRPAAPIGRNSEMAVHAGAWHPG